MTRQEKKDLKYANALVDAIFEKASYDEGFHLFHDYHFIIKNTISSLTFEYVKKLSAYLTHKKMSNEEIDFEIEKFLSQTHSDVKEALKEK
jgi:hypothetical protein